MAKNTKLVDFDRFTGIETWVHGTETGAITIERARTDDVEVHTAEELKGQSDWGPNRYKGDNLMGKRVARIHPLAYNRFLRECRERGIGGRDQEKYLARWLDDPDGGRMWRTMPGSLSR